jgi:hypothetical protein
VTAPRAIALCICTYRRAELLGLVLRDVCAQTATPRPIIVVDGDPGSGEVERALGRMHFPPGAAVVYVPSNHANLAYQRYLGWRAARESDAAVLVYLDDDLRLRDPGALAALVEPLDRDPRVAGATAAVRKGDAGALASYPILAEQRRLAGTRPSLPVRAWGDARRVPPGGLTPGGQRRPPPPDGGRVHRVEWLQGRVMAFAMRALTEDCFTDDLFALTHIGRGGLAEDTVLSHRVSFRGSLVWINGLDIEHPDAAPPNAYPVEPGDFGYATAYSRRLINDYYRGFSRPRATDRIALVKSYAGNCAVLWWRALRHPRPFRFRHAWGYLRGAVDGLWRAPRAARLTPSIDWWGDARRALADARQVDTAPGPADRAG